MTLPAEEPMPQFPRLLIACSLENACLADALYASALPCPECGAVVGAVSGLVTRDVTYTCQAPGCGFRARAWRGEIAP